MKRSAQSTLGNFFKTRRPSALPVDTAAGKKSVLQTLSEPTVKARYEQPASHIRKLWEIEGLKPTKGAGKSVDAAEAGQPAKVARIEHEHAHDCDEDDMDSEASEADETELHVGEMEVQSKILATQEDQKVVLNSLSVIVQDLGVSMKELRGETQRFKELQGERTQLCASLAETTNRLCKLGAPYPRELDAEQQRLAEGMPALVRQCRAQKAVRSECVRKVKELKTQRDQLLVASQHVARDLHSAQCSYSEGLREPAASTFPTWGALFEQNMSPVCAEDKENTSMPMEPGAKGLIHTSLVEFVSSVVQRLATHKCNGGMVTQEDIASVLSGPGFPQ